MHLYDRLASGCKASTTEIERGKTGWRETRPALYEITPNTIAEESREHFVTSRCTKDYKPWQPLSRCIKVEKEVDGPPPAAALGDAVHVRGGLVVGRDHAVAG